MCVEQNISLKERERFKNIKFSIRPDLTENSAGDLKILNT